MLKLAVVNGWLGQMLTIWNVHCLDDIATMRSPRVTLWKRRKMMKPNGQSSEGSYYNQVAIWRN